jgi:hypothetical protein
MILVFVRTSAESWKTVPLNGNRSIPCLLITTTSKPKLSVLLGWFKISCLEAQKKCSGNQVTVTNFSLCYSFLGNFLNSQTIISKHGKTPNLKKLANKQKQTTTEEVTKRTTALKE